MKIKEIIINGFKSYGKRTVLNNFDHQFNAITGLNGSGKSNILDAICFCIGLTSYKMARAAKVQDLIYKSGHAGIVEASVTITFDNSDKSASPNAYKHLDVISVTRKIMKKGNDCKSYYYVNGVSNTNSQVKAMFKSIGLNVDSPETFFVGQGKITKIVSFKPESLKEMLQEAAGTAYYQGVSIKTEKTVKMIGQSLEQNEERIMRTLAPQMKKLKKDKAVLDEYKKSVEDQTEIEKELSLIQICTLEKSIEDHKEEIHSLEKEAKSLQLQKKAVEEEEKTLIDSRNNTASSSNMNAKANDQHLKIQKLEEQHKDLEDNVKGKKMEVNSLRKNLVFLEKEILRISGEIKELKGSKSEIETICNRQKQEVDSLEPKLENLKTERINLKRTLENLQVNKMSGGSSEILHHLRNRAQTLNAKLSDISQRIATKNGQLKKLEKSKLEIKNNKVYSPSQLEEMAQRQKAVRKKLESFKPKVKTKQFF